MRFATLSLIGLALVLQIRCRRPTAVSRSPLQLDIG